MMMCLVHMRNWDETGCPSCVGEFDRFKSENKRLTLEVERLSKAVEFAISKSYDNTVIAKLESALSHEPGKA